MTTKNATTDSITDLTQDMTPVISDISPDTDNSSNTESQVIDQFFTDTPATEYPEDFKSGFVSIIGRPNVGKSTLMNHLLGHKVSITSRKPQTTRHKIVGIDSQDDAQIVYVDTPGMHKKEVRAINKAMNQAANSALRDVNVLVFVVDALKWTEDDELVLSKIKRANIPTILAINKVDTITRKQDLLPYLNELQQKHTFADMIPLSALKHQQLDTLHDSIIKQLPVGQPLYAADQITDRSERFMASEMIREKIMRQLGEELPYDLTVQIDSFKREDAHVSEKTGKPKAACLYVDATIFVARNGQKAIVIGDKGQKLKLIGTHARVDMEDMFGDKVMLTLWVKVKDGWSDDERALKSLGYGDI